MAYANSQFVWISQSFCSFFETGSFRVRWCFSLTPILCCWGNLVFDSDSRPNIHFLLFKTENLKKWAHQNTVYLLLNVPLLTYRRKNWNIYCKFENGGKMKVLLKQQTQDLHSKRAPASKSGVCCAFDISIEGWVGAFIRERAANKSFPGVKTSQIPTEGKYGTSSNPVLSTLNERGNRRRGRMAEASWGKMRLWSHPGIS